MHIPDGMLSPQVTGGTAAAGAAGVAYAVAWVRRHVVDHKIVMMSVLSALVFALQMLNFPIAPGVSGHFAGGAAVAILLGPWPAVIVMTTVLLVQAVMFADGGVLALGANVLNMAIVGPLAAFLVWRALGGATASKPRMRVAAWTSGWVAVVASALALTFELWLSGRVRFLPALAVLGGWHAIIGIVEGVITVGLVSFVLTARPEFVASRESGRARPALILGVIALLAGALSWLASSHPDALDWFSQSARLPSAEGGLHTPFAGYAVDSLARRPLSTAIAAIAGLVVVALIAAALATALRARTSPEHAPELHEHAHAHVAGPEHQHPHHHSEQDHEHAHASSFEQLTYIVSPVHRIDPRAKALAAIALIMGLVSSPAISPVKVVWVLALLLAIALVAKVPPLALLKRSLAILPVAAAIALYAPFMTGGWMLAATIITKAWLSALTVLLVAATTPSAQLVKGLRGLGMPLVFATTLTLLQRFAGALGARLTSMRHAVASRAGSRTGARLLPVYGSLAGASVVRSYEHGERIHAAMLSRGFTGELPAEPLGLPRPSDLIVLSLAVLIGLVLLLY